ncbi:MAG: hypothetical protein GY719_03420 [bacterium]|nr:hypothetical protein [bacterium]
MRDWPAFVRERLGLDALEPERAAAIVEEVAQHLENTYEDALASGDSEIDAARTAERHAAQGRASPPISSRTRASACARSGGLVVSPSRRRSSWRSASVR